MRTLSEDLPRNPPWPQEVWNQLDGLDFRLLEQLQYLSKTAQRWRQSGALYCCPGRKWLAQRLGCSVVTISRHVSKLHRLQVLERIQRRPLSGQWQTNLYRPIHWVCWKVAAVRRRILDATHRVSKAIHKPPYSGASLTARPSEGGRTSRPDQWRAPT